MCDSIVGWAQGQFYSNVGWFMRCCSDRQAKKMLEKGVSKGNTYSMEALGYHYLRMGDHDEAIRYFEMAAEKGRELCYIHAGDVCDVHLNDPYTALKYYEMNNESVLKRSITKKYQVGSMLPARNICERLGDNAGYVKFNRQFERAVSRYNSYIDWLYDGL